MKFTDKQLEAINHRQGPCLVLAVPGAGKTTVLLERLEKLISCGIDGRAIASLTFSRQQALDMRNRYMKKHPSAEKMTFSTIHAFCYSILRAYYRKKGKSFNLIEGSSEYNKYNIIRSIYRAKYKNFLSEDELDDFFRIDGYLKNALIEYAEYKSLTGQSMAHFEYLSSGYEAFKRKHNLIDFDDMLLLTLDMILKDEELLNSLRGRFKYFQLDEAQDSSAVQIRILQLLASPLNNLLMVADDDQAIYGFRGADPSYLLRFKKAYPDAKIITMEDNYRSAKNIVNLAGSFIVKNTKRYKKKAISKSPSKDKTQVILCKSLTHQRERIMEELESERKNSTTALLFRNNYSIIAPADALYRAGIPFHASANSDRFFKHLILSDMRDFFSLAKNSKDIEAYSRIYYKLNHYLKKSFLEEIYAYAGKDVWESLLDLPGTQNSFYKENIEFLSDQFHLLSSMNVHDGIWQLFHHIGYGDYLNEISKGGKEGTTSYGRIIENLLLLSENFKDFKAFDDYLNRLQEGLIDGRTRESNLFLSTIHASKGLEYDNVYVIDLIQGEFPSATALDFMDQGRPDLLEEERRLFYVAMTRAKDKLKLFGRKSVNGIKTDVSQFINELAGKKLAKKEDNGSV